MGFGPETPVAEPTPRKARAESQLMPAKHRSEAIKLYGLDVNKPNPSSV